MGQCQLTLRTGKFTSVANGARVALWTAEVTDAVGDDPSARRSTAGRGIGKVGGECCGFRGGCRGDKGFRRGARAAVNAQGENERRCGGRWAYRQRGECVRRGGSGAAA